jgi:PhnB protein
MHTITPHIVVRGAAQAAEWYKQALGAQEQGQRIAVPGGKFVQIELWFGDSAVMVADEFPDLKGRYRQRRKQRERGESV